MANYGIHRERRDLSKKERKRILGKVAHSCSICKDHHPQVRKAHGYYTDRVRKETADVALRGHSGCWRAYLIEEMLEFEAKMHDLHNYWLRREQRIRNGGY